MIRGIHGLFYSSDPEGMRAFIRDKLQFPNIDSGGGWLIYDLPEADIGVHPVDVTNGPPPGTHDVSFYCDDIEGTVAALRARGVEFTQDPADHGYGLVTYFTMPGGVEVQLFEPKYAKATQTARAPAVERPTPKKPAPKKPTPKKPAPKKPAPKKAAKKK